MLYPGILRSTVEFDDVIVGFCHEVLAARCNEVYFRNGVRFLYKN